MTTEEILRIINHSYIRTLSEFSERSKVLFPELEHKCIIGKENMGVSGILATMRCYTDTDEIIVKGFLYPTDNWSEETHGYIVAKSIKK